MTNDIMYAIDLRIQARAQGNIVRQRIKLDGKDYEILQLTPAQRAAAMTVSFELATERLQQLPRMFIEPDGAFVWVAQQGESPWQLDGCLYDRHNRMLYVDVAGTCPAERFDLLLAAVGWPESELVFQLRQDAVFLSESAWRRLAASGMQRRDRPRCRRGYDGTTV